MPDDEDERDRRDEGAEEKPAPLRLPPDDEPAGGTFGRGGAVRPLSGRSTGAPEPATDQDAGTSAGSSPAAGDETSSPGEDEAPP